MSNFREETCPACGYHVAVPFYDGGQQTLATLAWPGSMAEASELPRFGLDFVRCVDCGHVFNACFDYANVPYSTKPNLMFNQAANEPFVLVEFQAAVQAAVPGSWNAIRV